MSLPASLKTVIALAAFLAVAAGVTGCAGFLSREPNAAELDVFECQLAALEDAVPREAAEDLVMAARSKNFGYVVQQLLRFGLTEGRIEAVADAFVACSAPVALEPEAVDPSDAGVPVPGVLHIEAN
jgi:hypothetical protein